MKMMRGLLLALVPATAAALWYFRLDALLLMVVSIVSAVGAEALYQFIFRKPIKIKDYSAVVTGLLLALTVSPSLPLPMMAAGAAFGIIFGKQVWGGLGKNIFNPALTGRIFIVFAFPGALNPWLSPVEMVTTATPLQEFQSDGIVAPLVDLFTGNIAGSIGETSALLLLLGASFLFWKKFANWRIPAGMIGAVAVIALLYGDNPLFHILSGSLLLGALYMATDPMTSPKTQSGRWLFGILVGIVLMGFRYYSTYPEGTTFAILIGNALVPLINKYTAKKPQKKVA